MQKKFQKILLSCLLYRRPSLNNWEKSNITESYTDQNTCMYTFHAVIAILNMGHVVCVHYECKRKKGRQKFHGYM